MRYESFGPVVNEDGTPTEFTKQMLDGTGRANVDKRDTDEYFDCPEHRTGQGFFVQLDVPEDFWTNYRATLMNPITLEYHDEYGNHTIYILKK